MIRKSGNRFSEKIMLKQKRFSIAMMIVAGNSTWPDRRRPSRSFAGLVGEAQGNIK
jgi:hypothetical protein